MDASASNHEHSSDESYEQTYVHSVYNSIASHFSQTRYKPWPIVDRFLKGLPLGSVGVDIGCGNGKYLAVRDDLFVVGSDRSDELVKIAKEHEKHDALVADALDPPHPAGRFDFAISIAVLHHLSTRDRRIEGVSAVLQLLRSQTNQENPLASEEDGGTALEEKDQPFQGRVAEGQALFFVWALEQKGSRRGWDKGGEQDVLVPWVLKGPNESSKQSSATKKRSGPNSSIDNNAHQNPSASTEEQISHQRADGYCKEPKVFQRYYHLYHEGELEEDIVSAGGEVIDHGYDRDNWWCIARRRREPSTID